MTVNLGLQNFVITLLTFSSLYLSALPMSLFAIEVAPEKLSFTSPIKQVSLLELYSSQGCSSCPPAEKWLNQFVSDPKLWQEVIPMVFHVDYWDYIGWSDPFASAEYSQRQQNYKRVGLLNSVYTPGFVINGREWRGWFRGRSLPAQARAAGILTVDIDANNLSAVYSPVISGQTTAANQQNLDVHMALLGFGLETKVKQGENAHKTLLEEFVVLAYEQRVYKGSEAVMAWPKADFKAPKYAIVVWMTKSEKQLPLQGTGGYIPRTWLLVDDADSKE